VGMHRTGLQTPEQTLDLARHVANTRGLRLDGLFFYPGHLSQADSQAMIDALKRIDVMLHTVLNLWKRDGLEAKIVSGGSTPTAMVSHHVTAATEIRPGTYIYNDRNTAGGGWCDWSDCAAVIHATVVSTAVPDHCVVDAGGKTLTYDRYFRTPTEKDHGRLLDFPDARIVSLSEEHGKIDLSRCPVGSRPKVGQRVRIVVNHVCPCVNLFDRAWLRSADGTLAPITIDARGMLS